MKPPEPSKWQNEATWDYLHTKWSCLRWATDKMKLPVMSNVYSEAIWNEQLTKWSLLKLMRWSYLRRAMDKVKLPETSKGQSEATVQPTWDYQCTKWSYKRWANGRNEVIWDDQLSNWSYLRLSTDEKKYLRWATDKMELSEMSNGRNEAIRGELFTNEATWDYQRMKWFFHEATKNKKTDANRCCCEIRDKSRNVFLYPHAIPLHQFLYAEQNLTKFS